MSGCGGGGSGGDDGRGTVPDSSAPAAVAGPHSQCSLSQARQEVLDIFETFYFFNGFAEQQQKYAAIRSNLTAYPSVDALLDELRYRSGSVDRGFSYYATREQVEQFFEAGEFYGFGFTLGLDPGGLWRIIDVYGGSPADLAGLRRGDTVLEVDGTSTTQLALGSEAALGPDEPGVGRTFRIRDRSSVERQVRLVKTVVNLDPVPADRIAVFEVAGRRVGYLFFRTFIESANARLRSAMAELGAQGIDDLIIDLRYNGGGRVATAEILGSLMAGNARVGQTFFSYEYNDQVTAQYGSVDDVRSFRFEADALNGLENVYYLTGGGSASASELLISGLAPYMPRSVTVGARTFGKPVGQWGIDYCNDSMVLLVVTFRTVNVLREADYYGGIPADCAAVDDWDRDLGDPQEARLRAALTHVETNGSICEAPLSAATMSLAGGELLEAWQPVAGLGLAGKLLNAY
jgi:C-terminal processing protease CtpA/Prc